MRITYRIFEAGAAQSIATAVTLKDGSVLQVKPEQLPFATLDDWTAAVGLTEGRTLITEGEQPDLTTDQLRVANAVRRLQSEFRNTRFQPQVTRHASRTLADQISEAKRSLKWVRGDATTRLLTAFNTGPKAGFGSFYHNLYIYSRSFATLEAFYTHYKDMVTYWEKPPTPEEAHNLADWVAQQPADCSLKAAEEALEALVSEELAADLGVKRHADELAELEAKVRKNPASLHAKSHVYHLDERRTPHLFARIDGGAFLPIYYSADFQWVGIRDMKGDIYKSFAGAGVKSSPQLYAMHPRTHQLWALV